MLEIGIYLLCWLSRTGEYRQEKNNAHSSITELYLHAFDFQKKDKKKAELLTPSKVSFFWLTEAQE